MNEAAPSIVVLFDSARSAEPPQSSGITPARALSTLPDAARVETSLPASKTGSARLDAVGQLAGLEPVEQGLALGVGRGPGVEPFCHSACCAAPRSTRLAGVREDLVGDDEGLLGVEAEHLLDGGELVGAEGGAVDLAGVLLARGSASR